MPGTLLDTMEETKPQSQTLEVETDKDSPGVARDPQNLPQVAKPSGTPVTA
jgi:hypothetical protein